MKTFFSARVISSAIGVSQKTIHRRAQRQRWPKQERGHRVEYKVPHRLRRACEALDPVPSIWEQSRTLRELLRAAAVLAYCRRVQRDSKRGIERALRETVSDFRHILKFSPGALRQWISAVERDGLAALREHKIGRVGRKSSRLEDVL